MARIRIVDAWLRCPTAPLTYQRAILVVADGWAEQRVLMRAYAESPDQTRPTMVLHGVQHAIGPAGTDPHGPWGIHVEPPADGRAQALRTALELAARHLARSKGNPPRLMDEEPSFDRKRTNYWVQGTPPDLPNAPAGQPPASALPSYYEPNEPNQGAAPWPAPHAEPPAPARSAVDSSTVHGFARAADAGAEQHDQRVAPANRRRYGSLVGHTIPLGLSLTEEEYAVLDALGVTRTLTASGIAALVGTTDGAAWMDAFVAKLSSFGLDLIAVARDGRGEPTYVLRG